MPFPRSGRRSTISQPILNLLPETNPTRDTKTSALHPVGNKIGQALGQQYIKDAGQLATAKLQPGSDPYSSFSSQWGDNKICAVRAIPLLGLKPNRTVSGKYFRKDNNPVNDLYFSLHLFLVTDSHL